ncbi:HlyD family efflux transporter periplasmic adaptor subunit [Hydrogenophaga sp. 5NK40-0174]|uniref:HlyD family secretion protein n=1 Tax=Hydrogenophaga sp. 5NK40-0174 TaxID=3127649 RepID=UPI003101F350
MPLHNPDSTPANKLLFAAWLISLAFTLQGCSEREPAPSPKAEAPTHPTYTASAKGRVDVEGGVIRLAARHDGIIEKVLVEEGERVRARQLLATLDDELTRRSLALASHETREIEMQAKAARVSLQAAAREVSRLEPLAAKLLVPRQELDQAHDTHAHAKATWQAAEAAIQTARARQSLAEQAMEERKIVAPLAGRIIQRNARPGNGVSTLNVTPLFLFVPDAPRIVRAELEEQYLDAVTLGQDAHITLEAKPEKTWHGKVTRIGHVVGERTPSDDPTERQDNRVLEVVLTLERADALLIGQRVIVRFAGA